MKFLRAASILSTSLAALLALTPPSAPAQTLYGVDSTGGFGYPHAVELTGPPAGPCAYPAGPMAGFPVFAAGPGACPYPLPFAGWPGLDGDITLDHGADTVWVAGVNEVAEYTTAGVQITGFNVPFNVTGLGFDCAGGLLWVSSAGSYRRLVPGCGAPTLSAGPFANPMGGALTDLDWDPMSSTLWACTSTGFIGNFAPGAAVPGCTFDVLPLGLVTPLTGLALDRTTPGVASPNRVLFVTDGLQIARINVAASCTSGIATLAAPTFAFPVNPFPVASGPLSGLAFSAHGVSYGTTVGPTISLVGNAILGGVPVLRMTGAMPGMAVVFANFGGALCPPLAGPGGALLYLTPTVVTAAISHGGTLSIPVALPAAVGGAGSTIYLQFVNKKAAGGIEATAGLLMTLSRC